MRLILQLCLLLFVLLSTETHAWGKMVAGQNIASGGYGVVYVDCTSADAPPTLINAGEAGPWGYELASDVRDGPNLYAYVKQNPWTSFDPDGLAEMKGYYPNKNGKGIRRLEADPDDGNRPLTKTVDGKACVQANYYDVNPNVHWATSYQGDCKESKWEPASGYACAQPTSTAKRNFETNNDPQRNMQAWGEAANKPLVKGLNSAIQTTFTEGTNTVLGGTAVALVLRSAARLATVEQYSLRAIDSGFYPVMTRGSSKATGMSWLEKGDVWKFGTTKNPATRYSDRFLRNTGDHGLRYTTEWQGKASEALQLERMKIQNFQFQNGGVLPAGNKITR